MTENLSVTLSDGRVVSYGEFGDPEGDPLILFHGWPCSRLQGRTGDEAARKHGFRLIVPDRPGIGDTTFQEGRKLEDWPPLFREFTVALGLEAYHFIAISGGAPYLYAAAYAMPQHILSATVLCGAVPLSLFPDRRQMLLPYRILLQARSHAPFLLTSVVWFAGLVTRLPVFKPIMSLIYHFLPAADRRVVNDKETKECLMEGFHLAIANGPLSVITDSNIYIDPWHFKLEEIVLPITLWHGDLDHNIPPKMAEKVVEALPNGRIIWCPGEGHYSLSVKKIDEALEALRRDCE